eukprot:g7052.t1
MDEMGSEESFQEVPAIQVPMTNEERLLRRLSEVDKFVANITAELQKSKPCEGAISRELMELELGALNRDRESIEQKLGLLLPSFAVAPKDGSYELKHGSSPPDIAPGTNANNVSSTTRFGKKRSERVKKTSSPSAASSRPGDEDTGNRPPLTRTGSGTPSGHASNAPPSSTRPEYGGETSGPVHGGGNRSGRGIFRGGGPRKRPYSSVLGERDQYDDPVRQGGRRRKSAPSLGTDTRILDAHQRQHQPPQDDQRADRRRWGVAGSHAWGHEDRQYQARVGEPIQPVRATPPPPEGFSDGNRNRDRVLHGAPDGVFRGVFRGRRGTEPQLPERGMSLARNGQHQGEGGSTSSSGGRRGGVFRAPKIASLIDSNSGLPYASPAHNDPPARSPLLRGTPRQLEGGFFRQGGGAREGLAHGTERRFKRRPFRQGEEPTDANRSRGWHTAPPAWPVEEVESAAGGRAAYGGARVSVPVAMAVDTHHVDRSRTNSHESDYRPQRGVDPRHVDTSRGLGRRRAGPSDHPDTKRFAHNTRFPVSNSYNQRYVEDYSSNDDYSRPFDGDGDGDGNGTRAVGTHSRLVNQDLYDKNSRYVDGHRRQTPRHYNDVESRGGKIGRWPQHQERQGLEREQRPFQVQGGTPQYSPRLASRVTASNERNSNESSGWAQGKLDAYSYGLTLQSPTH